MKLASYYNQKEYKKIGGFRKRAILSFVTKLNSNVLDVGCSDGLLGKILKDEKKSIVWGIDVSTKAVCEARKIIDNAFVYDLSNLPNDLPLELKDKKFDYLIISEVLEHLLFPENLVKNVRYFMHDNSRLIVTVPNVLFWKNRLKLFFGNFSYTEEGLMDRGHIHFFSYKSFKEIFQSNDFEIIAEKHHTPTRGTKFLVHFFPGLFAYQFILCLKKI